MNDELETARIQFVIAESRRKLLEKERNELSTKLLNLRIEWEKAKDTYLKKTLEIKDE